jgi:hypothetical protein
MTTQATGWDKAKAHAEEANKRGGMFVKLENDGDKVVGVFIGDPHTQDTHWTGSGTEICTGEGCKKCAAGERASFKAKMNFYTLSETLGGGKTVEVKKMQIMNLSLNTFKDVLKVRDKYGLDKRAFEVERKGKKGDTKTSYTVLPDMELSAEQRGEIASAKLHDLTKDGAEEDAGDFNYGVNAVISPESSAAIVGRLKLISASKPERLQEFLTKFKVAKIKELKASEEKAALAWLDEAEGKGATPPPQPNGAKQGEVDPFA